LREELKKVTSKHSISLEHFFIPSRQRIALASVCCHSKRGRVLGWVSWSRHRQRAKARAATFRASKTAEMRMRGTRVKNKLCRRIIKEMTAVNFGGSRPRFRNVFSRERRNCFHQSRELGQIKEELASPFSRDEDIRSLNLAIFL